MLIPSANVLTDYYQGIAAGRASARASVRVSEEMVRLFEDVSAETISAILLKSVLDLHGVYQKLTLAKAAKLIGGRIEDEARFHYYSIISPPDVVEAMNKRVKATGSSPKYRRISTKIITEKKLIHKVGYTVALAMMAVGVAETIHSLPYIVKGESNLVGIVLGPAGIIAGGAMAGLYLKEAGVVY